MVGVHCVAKAEHPGEQGHARDRRLAREGDQRQGMIGGAKAQYDCIKAFSETDFTEDLKAISQPVLMLHGDDDQIVPYRDAGPLSAKLLKDARLKIYPGYPHGMLTVHPDVLNKDILDFIRT